MQSWARGEAPGLFIGSSLGKDLGSEKHGVCGLCVGPQQPCNGDNRVVPVPSTLQEWHCPGNVPAKAFLARGNGKFWEMPRLSVVGCGLGKRSPTKSEGHKDCAGGQRKHKACPPKQTLSAQVNFRRAGEGGGLHIGWAAALQGGQRQQHPPAPCACLIFHVVTKRPLMRCSSAVSAPPGWQKQGGCDEIFPRCDKVRMSNRSRQQRQGWEHQV